MGDSPASTAKAQTATASAVGDWHASPRSHVLEGAGNLVFEETEVAPNIALAVDLVVPLQLATKGLLSEFSFAFASVLGRNKTLEGVFVVQDTDFVLSRQPSRVGKVGMAVVHSGLHIGLDEDGSTGTVNRVETERFRVNRHLDATEVNVDPSIVPEGFFTVFERALGRDAEDVVNIGFVAEDIHNFRRANKDRVTISTVAVHGGLVGIAGKVTQSLEVGKGELLGGYATAPSDSGLVFATSEGLGNRAIARTENGFGTSAVNDVGASVSRVNLRDSHLHLVNRALERAHHGKAIFVNADRLALTAEQLKRGGIAFLTPFSSIAGRAARSGKITKHRAGEAFVSDGAGIGNGDDVFANVSFYGAGREEVSVRVVENKVFSYGELNLGILRGDSVRVGRRVESTIFESHVIGSQPAIKFSWRKTRPSLAC